MDFHHRQRDRIRRWLLVSLLSLAASVAVASNPPPGQLVGWGLGQTYVPPSLSNVVAVAAGSDHNLALRTNGTLVAWGGGNSYGQANVPSGLTNVAAIAARNLHNLALRSNGTVVAWGFNGQGQTNVPPELTNVAAIAAGGFHSLALRYNSTVVAWGDNSYGQADVPPGLTNVAAIAAGYQHSLALRSDGTVVAWGDNSYGQTSVPPGLTNVAALAGGGLHCLALLSNGTMAAWGDNSSGQCDVPRGLTDATAIAAGHVHSVALRSNSTVIAWGYDYYSQTNVPPGLTNVVAIAAGSWHSLALRSEWPPTIVVQPISQSIFIGLECTLSVAASSSKPFGYQWRFNGNDIPGATNSELMLPAVRYADAGVYSVAVSNALGSETSQPANLTVTGPPPNITTQPVSQPFHLGENVMVQVVADGPGLLNYQWRLDGVAIPGATNASLVISNASHGSRGAYTVMVRNSYGSVTSNPALLFLPFEHDFTTPEGPLLWDFSGTYPSPLGTLQQNENGFLVNNVGAQGRVWPNGSSVGVSLTRSWAPYWIEFSSTHVEYIFQDSCTTTLTLGPGQRLLVGNTSCVTVGQEYVLFLFTWAAYRNLTTNLYSAPIDPPLPLPDGVDGHWKLALDVVPDANQLTGQAFITLSSGNVISLEVTSTNSTVNKSVLKLQSSLNYLEVVTTGPEMALQSIRGNVAGQSVDYVSPLRTSLLTLNIDGSGNVTPLMDGQALVIGKDYTLHAAPRPGNLFSNWIVAGTVVNNPTLRFTMSSNLVIAANFVPNPFLTLKGSYSGLFYDTNEPAHVNAGLFTLTLRDKGSFSGKLQQGATKCSFSGQFDLTLSAQKTVPRKGTSEVVVCLQLTGGSDRLLGSVSNAAWASELFGYRADFNTKSNPATNFQGNYTLLLPGADISADGPMSHGFAQLGVNSGGSVSFKGTLGDGSAAVQKVPLAANGQWPLYMGLYSGKGSVFGWLTLFNTLTNDVIGLVLWTKPGGVKGPLHPAGFTNETETLGSRYVAPASGTRVLDFTSAGVVLHGGNLPATLTNTVILSERNQVTVDAPNAQKLSIALTVSSGSFKGSFVHPQSGKATAFKGVLLQKQNFGAGFFPGTNQSGRVFFGEPESEWNQTH